MLLELKHATEVELRQLDQTGFSTSGDADGEGFGALQMLAGSLALCTGALLSTYARNVLRVGVSTLSVTVRWSYAERPRHVDRMWLGISWPELPEDRVDAARRAVATCTVHRTLEKGLELVTEVRR